MDINDITLPTYKEHQPTIFDWKGAFLDDDRQNWLVVPVSQTRDSGPLDRSNFRVALEMLGGENKNVEVHRFGHWGPGWYEIIIVRPGGQEERIAKEIDCSLADYPLLDEVDFSELEFTEACEYWENMSIRERVEICQRYNITPFAARRDDLPSDDQGELVSYLASGN